MEQPMVEVILPSAPSDEIRGRQVASPLLPGNEPDDDSTVTDDSLMDGTGPVAMSQKNQIWGHPCATGCGHYCWAATRTPVG